ncbi:thiol-disulfide oxidoreductase ResA [Lederbergia citrea]|uniref:Thiol-disulfide oxidoreductase ResA n=1 Tax=Lederbergia citrea TaxID=2833581 RepID=A0A942Z393_9BACI|nr:thiol-disulfide oxidoreductase ResA [Lederbergia citrea]MBS4176468.1 thiol-disulfide oxidoreductase ResA [Lederbergia citrea]MBS4203029.1 thiol-disulfide oxidoreductase ResA [Lederbergia citrea]MBS4222299.1 thiol-disulfide oxidoreductase ResA [Lederbergia citrea]
MSDKKKRRLMIRTIILSIMAAAVVYTLYANFTKEKHAKISVGDKAPDFVLTDMEGNKHKLSDYEGKGVFLNFWATYCDPCKDEMPDMNNQYKTYKDLGVEILAVNVGEPEFLINNFLQKYPLDYPILKDKTKDIMSMYKIYNLPATFLVDPEGKITMIEEGRLSEAKIKGMMESIKP